MSSYLSFFSVSYLFFDCSGLLMHVFDAVHLQGYMSIKSCKYHYWAFKL